MQTFHIGTFKRDHGRVSLDAVCRAERTRYGFRHLAELTVDGNEVASARACYYNRTWEAYEFQSVLQSAINKAREDDRISIREWKHAKRWAESGKRTVDDCAGLRTVAMVAKMADLLVPDQAARNEWKARMLRAGLENRGLDMPEDWPTLSEDEKERRLNGAIETLKSAS